MEKKYEITKLFTSGPLKGLKVKEITTVEFPVGFSCEKPIGLSGYVILSRRDFSPREKNVKVSRT